MTAETFRPLHQQLGIIWMLLSQLVLKTLFYLQVNYESELRRRGEARWTRAWLFHTVSLRKAYMNVPAPTQETVLFILLNSVEFVNCFCFDVWNTEFSFDRTSRCVWSAYSLKSPFVLTWLLTRCSYSSRWPWRELLSTSWSMLPRKPSASIDVFIFLSTHRNLRWQLECWKILCTFFRNHVRVNMAAM